MSNAKNLNIEKVTSDQFREIASDYATDYVKDLLSFGHDKIHVNMFIGYYSQTQFNAFLKQKCDWSLLGIPEDLWENVYVYELTDTESFSVIAG